MRILVIGPYFQEGETSTHNCEVGVYNALRELHHEVYLLDPRSDIYIGFRGDRYMHRTEADGEVDLILCPGCGTNPKIFKTKFWRQSKALKVNWNSEPLMLPEYYAKLKQQKDEFDLFFTFDEAEIPLYRSLGIEKVGWLPQAFNPQWYNVIVKDLPPCDICFVGSIGGKWLNREHILRRIQMSSPVNVAQGVFNGPIVNKYYNAHKLVLNLGLYIPELGPIEELKGSGYQQRIFEAIGAGSVVLTNAIQTDHPLFVHNQDILFYDKANLEDVIRLGLDPQENIRLRQNILNIREQHTYKTRMDQMLKMIEKM